jgi:nucleoside-diphosphate-sugar epimerase
MKVLMLGGTGLISTAISRQLLERGVDLTLYNRGQTAARLPASVKVITGDRNDFNAFEQQMQATGHFDCVIDMICFTPPQAESSVRAFRGRVGQFIFCSTVDVYAKPASRYPITEVEQRRGNNDYARNKVLCEDVFTSAHNAFPLTILRPAFTYGEGGKLLDSFGWTTIVIDRLRKGKPIIVHGDGSAFWVACHVDDAAVAFVNAVGNSQAFSKTYHVAGEEWLTWNRYFELMAEAAGAPPPTLVHIPTDLLKRIDPQRALYTVTNFQGNNLFDNTLSRADLGFRYTISWREGAERAIRWLDQENGIENSDNDPFQDRIIAQWQTLTATLCGQSEARF